jgi:hypothetical protein
MVRGDGFGVLNKVRDWKYFNQQNTYAAYIADSELKAKVYDNSRATDDAKDSILCAKKHVGGNLPSWCSI